MAAKRTSSPRLEAVRAAYDERHEDAPLSDTPYGTLHALLPQVALLHIP